MCCSLVSSRIRIQYALGGNNIGPAGTLIDSGFAVVGAFFFGSEMRWANEMERDNRAVSNLSFPFLL